MMTQLINAGEHLPRMRQLEVTLTNGFLLETGWSLTRHYIEYSGYACYIIVF